MAIEADLRQRNDRLYFSTDLQAWVVTGHSEMLTILKHPGIRVVSPIPSTDPGQQPDPRAEALLRTLESHELLLLDGPGHRRLRRALAPAFLPGAVDRLGSRITTMARDLVDARAATGQVEVLDEIAAPLVRMTVATALGVPEQDREEFDTLARKISKIFLYRTPHWSPDALTEAETGMAGLTAVVSRLADDRRARPRDDLLSTLVNDPDPARALSMEEVVVNLWNLYLAGLWTTAHLLATTTYLLFSRPGLAGSAHQDPGLVSRVVQETLRYVPPTVELVPRQALRDVQIDGHTIKAGDRLRLMVTKANRDQTRYTDPDTFDPTHERALPLSFSGGPHYCIGAQLAITMAQRLCQVLTDPAYGARLTGPAPSFHRTLTAPVALGLDAVHLQLHPRERV